MHERYIDEKEIGEHMHMQLIKRGFAPAQTELDTITEIVWDYLVDVGVIRET